MTRKELGEFILALIVAVGVIVFWFACAMAVMYGQETPKPPSDPFEGMNSHQVPHCSPRGGPQSARCTCLGRSAKVQTKLSEDCWTKHDPLGGLPDDPIVREMRQFDPPPKVAECLGKVPDHCYIVAQPDWRYRPIHGGMHSCRTACKPERCGCTDSACKSHEESELY